jgi:hypothetical protein
MADFRLQIGKAEDGRTAEPKIEDGGWKIAGD